MPLSLHDGHSWQLPTLVPLVGMFLHGPSSVLTLQLGFPNHIQTFFFLFIIRPHHHLTCFFEGFPIGIGQYC